MIVETVDVVQSMISFFLLSLTLSMFCFPVFFLQTIFGLSIFFSSQKAIQFIKVVVVVRALTISSKHLVALTLRHKVFAYKTILTYHSLV